jgi:transcriptional regulator with XRE-family HTH domain
LHFAAVRERFEKQMADYLVEVGRRLHDARIQNRPDLTSHEKAAHELQATHGVVVSGKQYGRWERGESEPRTDKREAIAAMLRVDVTDIWGLPPIAPEVELRAQLDRLEARLDAIAKHLGIDHAEVRDALSRLAEGPALEDAPEADGQPPPDERGPENPGAAQPTLAQRKRQS